MSEALQNARLEQSTRSGGLIDLFIASIPKDDTARSDTAVAMLVALREFARRMALFFEHGFSGAEPKLKHRNVTPNYVYGLLSEQVGYDLDAIMRAYYQHRLASDVRAANANVDTKLRSIADADELAYSILAAAMQGGIDVHAATVLTYFQKSLRIRILPYARVALIGVPYSALSIQNDWLALAHEIGHYVYRNSIIAPEQNTIKSICKDPAKPWYSPWLEEIVADVFGCLIAGPMIGASMQELSLRTRRNEMTDNDGRHPAPVLRPYIYIDTLEQLGKFWGNVDLGPVARKLEKDWDGQFDPAWLDSTNIQLPGASDPLPISIAEARAKIKAEVIALLVPTPTHQQSLSVGGLTSLITWLKPGTTTDDYLFRKLWGTPVQWAVMVEPLQAPMPEGPNLFAAPSALSELIQAAGKVTVQGPANRLAGAPVIEPETLDFGKTNTELDLQIEVFEAPTAPSSVESTWVELLEFGGWIEQGPSGGTAH